MNLENLMRSVTDAIQRHNDPRQPEYPQENLVGFVQDIFRQHLGGGGNRGQYGNVRPASEDPYGDPADLGRDFGGYGGRGQYGNVRPASEDPYGDPADIGGGSSYGGRGQFGNVRPASEDPYGDPADQERRRW
jgi:hypothetical protein